MTSLNFEQARRYAENRLEQELSPNLHYHGILHTRDEVVPAVELLAAMEGITGRSLILLCTAAWFHDLGYVESALHHELISARIAAQMLPTFGYTAEDVEVVRWAILATALPQAPKSRLEEVLTDADLDVLGRDDFMRRNGDLRSELRLLGKEFTDEQWYAGQIKFLEGHTYFTKSAHSLRDAQKMLNLQELKKKLSGLLIEENKLE